MIRLGWWARRQRRTSSTTVSSTDGGLPTSKNAPASVDVGEENCNGSILYHFDLMLLHVSPGAGTYRLVVPSHGGHGA